MTHYCHLEQHRYPEGEFELVRGRLFLHSGAGEPLHTDDGAPWRPPPVIGADESDADGGPPIAGPAADAGLDVGDHPDENQGPR